MMRKIILFSVVMVLVTGCAETTSMIQRNLSNRAYELTYENADNPTVEKKAGTLSIGFFVVEDVLPPDTTVVEVSSVVVPLLFINAFSSTYQANLGYDRIINDYKEFMRESFVQEVKRSSILDYVEKKGDFLVDVTVHTIQIAAPIVHDGAFILGPGGGGGGKEFKLGPLAVDVQAKIVLQRNDDAVIFKNVGGSYKTDIYSSQDSIGQEGWQGRVDPEILIQDYTSLMVDGLSLAISDLNKNIVTMIDQEAEAIIQRR